MASYTLEIKLFSYWLQADKDGQSMCYDTVVLKENGLPIITGKAVKGLLSDGMDILIRLGKTTPNLLQTIFGTAQQEGQLKFGTAHCQTFIPEKYHYVLFHQLAAVTLDENKQAVDKQLRTMEVSCPLTLYATIDDPRNILGDTTSLQALQQSAQLIKELGYKRHRGFGRCQCNMTTL